MALLRLRALFHIVYTTELVAPPFAEGRLLAVAQALEQELGMASRLGIDVRGD